MFLQGGYKFMKDKDIQSNTETTFSDPASTKYSKNIKERAHEKSPYGKADPSPNTNYK